MFLENEATESLKNITQDRLGSDWGIGPAIREYYVISLPSDSTAPAVDVKESDLLFTKFLRRWLGRR